MRKTHHLIFVRFSWNLLKSFKKINFFKSNLSISKNIILNVWFSYLLLVILVVL